MKKRLQIYALLTVLLSILIIALSYTRFFGWLLYIVWPLVVYGWQFSPTPLNIYLTAPIVTLCFTALLLSPLFIWARSGRKTWLIAQGVLLFLLIIGFVTFGARHFGSL